MLGNSLAQKWASAGQNISSLGSIKIPLLRKAFPPLFANKLVSVQPMSQPASLIFYLRYRYSLDCRTFEPDAYWDAVAAISETLGRSKEHYHIAIARAQDLDSPYGTWPRVVLDSKDKVVVYFFGWLEPKARIDAFVETHILGEHRIHNALVEYDGRCTKKRKLRFRRTRNGSTTSSSTTSALVGTQT